MKKGVYLLTHCLLNDLAKTQAFPNENHRLPALLLEKGQAILQLPCPEFTFGGGKRWGMVKEQYDTPFYRRHCRQILTPVADQVEEYLRCGIPVHGIIGVKGSPSCGAFHTASAPSYVGEDFQPVAKGEGSSLVLGSGVFLEVLEEMLQERGLTLPFLEADEGNLSRILEELDKALEE